MKNIEKILGILDKILDIYELEPEEKPICFDLQEQLPAEIGVKDAVKIIEKLEKEDAIRILRKPKKIEMVNLYLGEQPQYNISNEIFPVKSYLDYYKIERTAKFDEYYKKIKNKVFSGKDKLPSSITGKVKTEQTSDNKKTSDTEELKEKDIALKLSYDYFSRKIFIEDIINSKRYLLKTPNYDSANQIIFKYLYKYPNDKVRIEKLRAIVEKESGRHIIRKLHNIASDLGFTGDIKKLFLLTSNNSAEMRTEITTEQIEKLKVDINKIFKNLKPEN